MQPDDDTQGVWLKETNTFYWLETGPIDVSSDIDRIRKTLTQRGYLLFNTSTNLRTYNAQPYKTMTALQAHKKQYKFERIFLNAHIKRTVLAQESETASSDDGW